MKNSINWFEIPVKHFDKAKKFYETVLGAEMQLMEAMGMKSAFSPVEMETGGIGGCIIQGEGYVPCINRLQRRPFCTKAYICKP
jgi:uncharacterized protein